MLDIKSLTMWAVGYEIANKARAKSLSEAENHEGAGISHVVHGRDSIHSIEQVRNKRMNKTVFAFLIVLFTVEVVAFVLCHYIVGESNGACATVLAVLTVSISLAFLVVTFFVSYYQRRKRRRDLLEEENEM